MRLIIIFLFLCFGCIFCSPDIAAQTSSDTDETEVLELISLAANAIEQYNYDLGEEYLARAQAVIDSTSSGEILFSYYQNLGYLFFQRNQLSESLRVFNLCLREAEKIGDTTKIIVAYSGIANNHILNRRYKEAINYQEKALEMSKDRNPGHYYGILINISNAYVQAQELYKALEALLEAKEYFKQGEGFDMQAIIENNIGELYRDQLKDYDLAKKHYQWAIELNTRAGNTYQLSQNYHNLSLLYSDNEQMDSAFYYMYKGIDLKKDMGDLGGLASSIYNLGTFFAKGERYDEAIQSFEETIGISEKNGIVPGLYFGNLGLGNAYAEKKMRSTALFHYKKAKQFADDMESIEMQKDIRKTLFDYYKQSENYKEALQISEELDIINDSIASLNLNEKLDDIRIRYETDLAEQENKRLREKEVTQQELISLQYTSLYILLFILIVITVLIIILYKAYRQRNEAYNALQLTTEELSEQYETVKKQELRLEVANNLKDKIFSVLGHDLRSPLINIIGLIDSISQIEFSRDEWEYLLNHLKGETNTTLKNLQNILQWAQLQINDKSIYIIQLDENEVITEVIKSYESNASTKSIKISYTNTNNSIFHADENQFRSIAANLIANALKYSPVYGEVKVNFSEEKAGFVFQVEDQGEGISQSAIHNLETKSQLISSYGTSGEKGTGIGLSIVKDFVELHNGTIEFIKNKPTGTIVKVTFPKDITTGTEGTPAVI